MAQKKILFIDDDRDCCEIFVRMAKHLGYDCTVARSGREGIQKALSAQPDIIFLDLIMPEIDGLEVMVHLKSLSQLARIPVVLYTAALEDPRYRAALKLGAAGALLKPASGTEIDKAVRAYAAEAG